MAQGLAFSIIADGDYTRRDRLQVEVDGVVLSDRILLYTGPENGYGQAAQQECGYGFWPGDGYGIGVYGAGFYGVGAPWLDVVTATAFPAGDYQVRYRVIDGAPGGGNIGDWSDLFTIHHRPTPGPPRNFRLADGLLLADAPA